MDRRQRMTLLGVAAAIAVAAVVIALVAGGGDDDKSNSTTAAQTSGTGKTGADTSSTATATTPPKPQPTRLQVKDGEPVGGVKKIGAKKNDLLDIEVSSNHSVPIHFHGYDVEKEAAPGQPAVFKLKAKIEGVFEMEVESTHTKIAEITVQP